MLSFPLEMTPLQNQKLDIELNALFDQINKAPNVKPINHIAIAYGVWGRVNPKGRKFSSKLNVDEISITINDEKEYSSKVLMNGKAVTKTDSELQFGYRYKRDKSSDAKKSKKKNNKKHNKKEKSSLSKLVVNDK
jgi:hypothetical protein